MSDKYGKLFMELDETFLDNINVEKISFDNDLLFFKLKELYLIINNIDDYGSIQKKLYENKTKKQIVELELARIKKKKFKDRYIIDGVLNIEQLLRLYDDIPDNVYEKIINLIIKIELLLDINVGLFNEVCKLYENERKIVEGSSYRKVRIGE